MRRHGMIVILTVFVLFSSVLATSAQQRPREGDVLLVGYNADIAAFDYAPCYAQQGGSLEVVAVESDRIITRYTNSGQPWFENDYPAQCGSGQLVELSMEQYNILLTDQTTETRRRQAQEARFAELHHLAMGHKSGQITSAETFIAKPGLLVYTVDEYPTKHIACWMREGTITVIAPTSDGQEYLVHFQGVPPERHKEIDVRYGYIIDLYTDLCQDAYFGLSAAEIERYRAEAASVA